MSKLYVACGIPGSGKSTYLANYVKSHYTNKLSNMYKIVSRDAIRFSLLKEGDDYFSCEREVFNTFIKEIFNTLLNETEKQLEPYKTTIINHKK